MILELTDEEARVLTRLVDNAWLMADEERVHAPADRRPTALTYQLVLERIQAKLAANS